ADEAQAPEAADASVGSQSVGLAKRSTLGSAFSVGGRSRRILEKERYVDAILQVSLASASTTDAKLQAQGALDELVRVLGAERAVLFILDDNGALNLLSGRTAEGTDLTELTGYSSTVVKRVRETRKPLVVTGTEQGEEMGSESAVAYNLRSIICAPLLLHDK